MANCRNRLVGISEVLHNGNHSLVITEKRLPMTTPLSVLVTGATGRTGSIVLQKLQQRPEQFAARGFARSEVKAKELFGNTAGFYLGDVSDPDSLKSAVESGDALVILTSAVPQMKAPPEPGQRPEFFYPEGGTPEQVAISGVST